MNKRIYIGQATGFYSWHRFHDFLINNGGEIGINVEYNDLKYRGRVADFNFNGITISYHSFKKIKFSGFPDLELYATGSPEEIKSLEELLLDNQKT